MPLPAGPGLAPALARLPEDRPVAGVLALPAESGDPLEAALALRQALADAGVRAPQWYATRAAVSVGPEAVPGAAQAPLWGLGRVAALRRRRGGPARRPRRARPAAACGRPRRTRRRGRTRRTAGGVFAGALPAQRPGGTVPGAPAGTVLITGGIAGVRRNSSALSGAAAPARSCWRAAPARPCADVAALAAAGSARAPSPSGDLGPRRRRR